MLLRVATRALQCATSCDWLRPRRAAVQLELKRETWNAQRLRENVHATLYESSAQAEYALRVPRTLTYEYAYEQVARAMGV